MLGASRRGVSSISGKRCDRDVVVMDDRLVEMAFDEIPVRGGWLNVHVRPQRLNHELFDISSRYTRDRQPLCPAALEQRLTRVIAIAYTPSYWRALETWDGPGRQIACLSGDVVIGGAPVSARQPAPGAAPEPPQTDAGLGGARARLCGPRRGRRSLRCRSGS